jgi:hypothetical protein
MTAMRWDALFEDLEAQAAALATAERAAEVDERTRVEVGTLTVIDRLRAAGDAQVALRLPTDLTLRGRVERVGPDWLLLAEDTGREALVATAALLGIRGLGRQAGTPGSMGVVASRLTLRHALRGVARDRSAVRLHLLEGSVDATIDRVGADFVDVALHPVAEPRRGRAVRDVELVPLRAVVAVRRSS